MMTPDESDEVLNEIADVLDLGEPELDALKLTIMETHEKASQLLASVKGLGHNFSVKGDDGDIYVNVAWLGTMLLLEGEQVMHGHGGCPDHLRVVDLIEITVFAAVKNVEQELDTPN